MANKNNEKTYEVRVITLGDSGVGKTNVIYRFTKNKFSSDYYSTIGIDTKLKSVKLDNGCEIKYKIFDTAGQERYKSISKNYIKKANSILLMYDIANEETFNNIENWMTKIKDNSGSDTCIILVGTKCDLENEREVSKESGEKLAKEYGFHFYETSSKENIKIKEVFYDIAEQIIEKTKIKNNINDNNSLNLKDRKQKKKGCC